ncbi:MAG: EF-P lysine aminoacylase GenX [Bdellovibrionales bacterium]|nr:EF-P lysine aminoacylase GenX [Bdellovibrionales bacterium]
METLTKRQEYLEQHWTKYPLPSPEQLHSSLWLRGRISALNAETLELESGQKKSLSFVSEDFVGSQELGQPCPISVLKVGDIVLLQLNPKNQQIDHAFLLSPCLSHPPPSADISWQEFLISVESFFVDRGFQGWSTPYLVRSPGVDAHIDFMQVSGVRTGREFCLPTSPEIELKKMIAAGVSQIFEIKSCFRDDDKTSIHKPEFKMLEWYRAYANKTELMDDIEALISFLFQKMNLRRQVKMDRISIAELFKMHAEMALTPQTSREDLLEAIRRHRLDWNDSDDWDDLFFRIYIEKIEPHLGLDNPVVIYNFPPSQSSVARLTPEGWSDRFEVYWKGIELANAYQEQNNPQVIREKIQSEVSKRTSLGRVPNPVDPEFLSLMDRGFPPCTGCALGLDRLFMVMRDLKTIY